MTEVSAIHLLTFRDAIEHLQDVSGGGPSSVHFRVYKNAIQKAYNQFYATYPWRYFQSATNIGTFNDTFTSRMKYTTATGIVSLKFNVLTASNTTPIVVQLESTFSAQDGETITISGAQGNTTANGTWVLKGIGSNQFELVGSSGSGNYVAGSGRVYRTSFPSWSAEGEIKIRNTYYTMIELVDNQNVKLTTERNPKHDDVGDFQFRRKNADLPDDFLRMSYITDGQRVHMSDWYVKPEDWLMADSTGYYNATYPFRWTILPHPTKPGKYRLHFNGTTVNNRNIHFIYQRRRGDRFRWSGFEEGTSSVKAKASIDISVGTKSVAGNMTNFRKSMEGSMLRIGGKLVTPHVDGKNDVTGRAGLEPYEEQHVIESVTNTSTLTLKTPVIQDGTDYTFVISDLIDLHPTHVNAFLDCCVYHYQKLGNNPKLVPEAHRAWMESVRLAMEMEYMAMFHKAAGADATLRYIGDPLSTDFGDYVSVGP